MSDLDLAVIKRTQQTLGKYVKKPPLTDKLLTKPPFRFLHDVFNAVIKETGCFAGLYTAEELNSDNIKDRDGKMRFLQKMIDVIKITSNKSVTVRTSKIVAGLEPEKTNELLQLMGKVIENKLNWESAVEQVLSGKVPKAEKGRTKLEFADNKGDKNSKTKANENSKEKENNPRDLKFKDAKKEGKTTLPPKKSNKTSKVSTEGSYKVDNTDMITKKQLTKEAKGKNEIQIEKSTVKTKPSKDKPKQFKDKISLPINNDRFDDEKATRKVRKDNSKELERKETENSTLEMTNNNGSLGYARRNSKGIEQESSSSQRSMPDNSVILDRVRIETSDADSGKLSSKYKRLSGNNRQTSGSVSAHEESKMPSQEPQAKILDGNDKIVEITAGKAPSDNLRDKEFQREEEQSDEQKLKSIEAHGRIESNAIPTSTTPPPTAAQNALPAEVKRESTFIRENSRDSISSNIANRPRTSLRPPSARPASARPGAPRRRDRNVEIVLQPNDQIKLSGINVKLESFGDLDDDGENLVVIEDANSSSNIGELVDAVKGVGESNIDSNLEQQGHLVQQILETQKELMQQQNVNSVMGKNDKDLDLANNSAGRLSSARQMNNLRDVIQNLSKSVNPFGKLMDFIPEDIDAMQLELTMWRDTYTQLATELKREKSLTESATEPMKNQLIQLEANIKEFMEMIDESRNRNLQNSEKILKMLAEQ